MNSFQESKTFSTRKNESSSMIKKYPNRCPIVCEKSNLSKLHNIIQKQYLLSENLTITQFLILIRKKIQLSSEKALFLLTEKNTTISHKKTIRETYNTYKNQDGFLYLYYKEEDVFG